MGRDSVRGTVHGFIPPGLYLRPTSLRSLRGRPRRPSKGDTGQATVEMALAFPLLFALIVGCLELGVGFNAYLTVASAAREGARAGAIYLYDSSATSSVNDQNRDAAIRQAVSAALGTLRNIPPYFDVNTDVAVGYVHDPSTPALDTRSGDTVVVDVTYRHQLLSNVLGESSTYTFKARGQARIE